MTLSAPITPRLPDIDSERVRRELDAKIAQLQKLPAMGMAVVGSQSLPDSTLTLVPHPLGRAPSFVTCSPPRGASSTGRLEEIRDGSYDRKKFVGLKATGWGATITVDVLVV